MKYRGNRSGRRVKEPIVFAVGDDVVIANQEKKAYGQGDLTVTQVIRLKSGEVRYVVCRKEDVGAWRKPSWRVAAGDIRKNEE